MNHPYRVASEEERPRRTAECYCCKRPWDVCIRAAGQGPDELRRPQRGVCRQCHDHGPDVNQKDFAHLEMWTDFARALRRDYRDKEAELRRTVSGLEQQLLDRPEKIVERYIGQDEIDEAREEAERAFRSREMAFRALCEVRLLHREGQPGQCRCGLRLDRCPMAEIVDRYRALEKWEIEQYRRLKAGKTHNLPDGHPALLDPRWTPEGE